MPHYHLPSLRVDYTRRGTRNVPNLMYSRHKLNNKYQPHDGAKQSKRVFKTVVGANGHSTMQRVY